MLNFQDLPDELVLKILSYQEAKDLVSCGQVSKRIRRISHDGTLWVTANLEKKMVKTELLERILSKGCRSLNLSNSIILGSLNSNTKSQLRVLKLRQSEDIRLNFRLSQSQRWPAINKYCDCESVCDCDENTGFIEELLFSCSFLQYLVIEGVYLTPKMAESICKNGKTLQVLHLNRSDLDCSDDFKSYWQEIFKCCQELREVDLAYVNYGVGLIDEDVEFFVKYIPPNIEKVNLSSCPQDPLWPSFYDIHVEILLKRCNKIKVLSLEATSITDKSLKNIRQCLNHTLEELSLGLSYTLIGYTGFIELNSMPRLKILNVHYDKYDDQEIQNLRKLLPQVMIKVSHQTCPLVLSPE